MWRALGLTLVLAACPASVAAGPWPREPGAWFAALEAGAERGGGSPRALGQLWLERGLTDRLTLAGKLRHDSGGPSAEAHLRLHAAAGPGGLRQALALGLATGDGATQLVATLHLGRSLGGRLGPGWARLDITGRGGAGGLASAEVMLQAGLRPRAPWLAMLGATAFHRDGTTSLTLTPALGRDLGAGRSLLTELALDPRERSIRALSLVLWHEF